MKPNYRRLCPKCGSDNVTSFGGIIGKLGIGHNKCKDCWYTGVVTEVEKELYF